MHKAALPWLLLLATTCCSLPRNSHAVFLPILPINTSALTAARQLHTYNASMNTSSLAQLHSLATAALTGPNHTVTATSLLPPNDDPRTYLSFDPYWWPAPTCNKTDYPFPAYLYACAYEYRDAVNPDTALAPSPTQLAALVQDATLLALATLAFDVGEVGGVAAVRAAQLLRVFFVDEATAMRPSLLYAQARMGDNDGRPPGGRPEALLDMRALPLLLQAEAVLYGGNTTALWRDAQHAQWLEWVANYTQWAVNSTAGQQVQALHNRHYTWYTCQLMALHYHGGDVAGGVAALRAYLATDYDAQFNATGGQPHEDGVAEWWANALSNAEALDCVAAYAQLLAPDANAAASLYRTPNAHGVTLYNVTTALLAYNATAGDGADAAAQQRLLPLAAHVLAVYGQGEGGGLVEFVGNASCAAGEQVYGLWVEVASFNCTQAVDSAADAGWVFYVQVIIIVGLTAIALAAIAVCVWRTRETDDSTDDAEGEEGEQEDEEEGEDDDESEDEEEETDDGVRFTHSRDSSLVSVMSANDLNADLLAEQHYDDTLVAQNGQLRPANGRRKTRVVSGVQRGPSV